MKCNGHKYWLRNILFRIVIQLFFLLKRVLFSRSTFQALTQKPQKGFPLDSCERSQKDQKKRVN